jgi:hypothetical protein
MQLAIASAQGRTIDCAPDLDPDMTVGIISLNRRPAASRIEKSHNQSPRLL